MSFKEALIAGIKRANDAAEIKLDIKKFFKSINDSLSDALGNSKVKISRDAEEGMITRVRQMTEPESQGKTYYDIHLSNRSRRIKIASTIEDELGFPLSITFNGVTTICFSLDDMTEIFKEILSSYDVGKAILELSSE